MKGEGPERLIVRQGSAADLPAVLRILQAAFAAQEGRIDPPSGANHETLSSLEAKLADETVLVAERDGAVVGCIWCMDEDGGLYIGRLATDPALQGQGIGRALLEASLDLARERAAAVVSLGVRVELVENIAFFERHGFVITRGDSHPGYERVTNYHMELTL